MQKLRGTGETFSTSGADWHPFRLNRHIIRQKGRLHRLIRQGVIPKTMTKEEARAMCAEAVKTHPIRRV